MDHYQYLSIRTNVFNTGKLFICNGSNCSVGVMMLNSVSISYLGNLPKYIEMEKK